MQHGSVLPFIHDAARHVERIIGCAGPHQFDTVRTLAAQELRTLQLVRPTPHAAAVAAAELLYLAEHLDIDSGSLPFCCSDAGATPNADPLKEDARRLAELRVALTRDDLTEILDHLDEAVSRHGIDLVQSLALEMKCERLRNVMRRSATVEHGLLSLQQA